MISESENIAEKLKKLAEEAAENDETEVAMILGTLAGAYHQGSDALGDLAQICFEFSKFQSEAIKKNMRRGDKFPNHKKALTTNRIIKYISE